jgi:23S rRNA pseudouridine1911/1915/1917 synthase
MHKGQQHDKEEESPPADGSEELYERLNLKVDKGQEPLRIDKFLVQRIENASRNKIQKALEAGMVLVNNKQVQPNYKIRPLDEIIVYSDKEAHGEEIVPEELP